MKRLFIYLKEYRRECVLGPLFKLFEAALELFVPMIMASIIDRGIPSGDRGYLVRMCLILILLGAVGLLASVTAQYFAARAATGFAARLRRVLYIHIQGFSYGEMDRMGTATMITRMTSDINQVQSGVNLTLRLLLRSPFVVLGAFVMALLLDVQAGMIFAVVIPLLALVVFLIMRFCVPLYRRVQEHLDRVLGITRENLTGIRVLRAFRRESNEIQEFDSENRDLTTMQLRVGRVSALLNPLTYVIVNLGLVVLLYTGALRVDAGILTQGVLVALVNYLSQILVELIKFANMIVAVNKAVASGKRIASVLEVPSGLSSGQKHAADGPAVKFDRVSLTYKNSGEPAIRDISFQAEAGQTIGIIGGTGAGKTSLIRLIPRFYDATEGCVSVFGTDVKEYDLQELRSLVGIVPQKAVLFQGTIRENLLWGREDASEEDLWEALRIAQAKVFVQEKEDGLDALVEQGGKNFSGGQRQRLTIARALVRRPRILILDDSASALDFATDAALRSALRKMPDSPVIFLISQRTSSLLHADLILVMEDGVVVGQGTHEELLKTCEVYREIYESQFRKEGAK